MNIIQVSISKLTMGGSSHTIRMRQDSDSIYITKEMYQLLITDLEAKARELWPDKFTELDISGNGPNLTTNRGTLKRTEREDGLTDTITVAEHEAIREQDRLNRKRQTPIGSRK